MVWASVLAIIVLIGSFAGGIKEGAVKSIFSFIAVIIALPLAGLAYRLLAGALSFMPGEDWENFLGYFITLGIISAVLNGIFLFPRKAVQKVWDKGILFRLLGGAFSFLGAAIGIVVFALVVHQYPIWGWLERALTGSGVINTLVAHFGFVQGLLPEVFRLAPGQVY
ncbi:MAG: CvpA family protein [Chloroflexi bacterium]|nr:CvpA family protein [Chloroflexota bacterium]